MLSNLLSFRLLPTGASEPLSTRSRVAPSSGLRTSTNVSFQTAPPSRVGVDASLTAGLFTVAPVPVAAPVQPVPSESD